MSLTETEIMLSVAKLEVVYHHVSIAVQGVSFQVRRGQIVTILGINGAGKTTTLRAVSGFIGIDNAKISEGDIEFMGRRIGGKPPHVITRRGIVLVPERDKIFESLTVEENLQVCLPPRERGRRSLEMPYDYFPALGLVRNRLGGYLSGGERQMLALAMGLLCRPRLLLVDELSLGLAPLIVAELMARLKVIRREQAVTVLLVEQNAAAALAISDYGYVMENG
ncbi:MAG: ABC transporter ATP-binding protein, partial [Proteobacteria bacterium]|nr:ABC transporter ATP-binding protein [Pseudomonadota bacterium]MBU1742378.1 ABC transporter ATP-binding protein [Pseudomonadota bacterium]